MYAGHAGASTLHAIFKEFQPKRVFPIFDDGPADNSILKISTEILNENCTIVFDFQCQSSNENCFEVTLDDVNSTSPKEHSFLHVTTVASSDIISEPETISKEIDLDSVESNKNQS